MAGKKDSCGKHRSKVDLEEPHPIIDPMNFVLFAAPRVKNTNFAEKRFAR